MFRAVALQNKADLRAIFAETTHFGPECMHYILGMLAVGNHKATFAATVQIELEKRDKIVHI